MNVLRIPVEDLKKGMYIVDVSLLGHQSEAGVFAYTGFVDSDEQWRSIRAGGHICAYVDPERSNPPLQLKATVTDIEYLDPQAVCPPPVVALADELEQAADLRRFLKRPGRRLRERFQRPIFLCTRPNGFWLPSRRAWNAMPTRCCV